MKKIKKIKKIDKKEILCLKCPTCKVEQHFSKFQLVQNPKKKTANCNTCQMTRINSHLANTKENPLTKKRTCICCGYKKLICDFRFRASTGTYSNNTCNECVIVNNNKVRQGKKLTKVQKAKVQKANRKAYMRRRGTLYGSFVAILNNASLAGVVCDITMSEYEKLMQQNKVCTLNPRKKIKRKKSAGNLDRIGKIADGGDGKKGGNYTLSNVIVADGYENLIRSARDLTVKEMRDLVKLVHQVEDLQKLIANQKVAAKFKSGKYKKKKK